MQDNSRFGDIRLKYELGRLMGKYAVPIPLGNFN